MSEVKAIEAVDNALSGLTPDERARVLTWAQLKFGTVTAPAGASQAPQTETFATQPAAEASAAKAKARGAKKSKTVISMDKSLNLTPSGKMSAADFAAGKAPANVMQKCVVAAYYLRETIAMPKVTVVAVFTFFKHLAWPIPADIKNTLQQAGTAGWLDTADSDDIKITSLGENLVEHTLPLKVKVK